MGGLETTREESAPLLDNMLLDNMLLVEEDRCGSIVSKRSGQ